MEVFSWFVFYEIQLVHESSLSFLNKKQQNPQICNLFKEYLKLLNRLYDITCSTISNIPYNLIFTTKFKNDSSIIITIISCDYLNLSLADEHVGDVTIPTEVIEYNQNFLQADQPIKLKYSNQIKLYTGSKYSVMHTALAKSQTTSIFGINISTHTFIKSPKQSLGDLLFLLRFLLLLFLFFSFLSADHELVHGRSQELLDRIS